MTCKICLTRNAVPYNGQECEVCSSEIRDGSNVAERLDYHRMQGVAFIRNGAEQWLVLWKTGEQAGHWDIVHQSNLVRCK